MTFPDKLKALREFNSEGPLKVVLDERQLHIASIVGPHNTVTADCLQDDAELFAFLANHAEAIERVVRAAEEADWVSYELRDALRELEKGAG